MAASGRCSVSTGGIRVGRGRSYVSSESSVCALVGLGTGSRWHVVLYPTRSTLMDKLVIDLQ